MLSWVVKVVPQPPDLKNGETKEEAPAPPPAPPPEKKVTFKEEGKDGPVAEGNGSGTTVLTWISNAMPQPVTSNNKEESPPPSNNPDDDSKGVMAWITHGLEKVVPHPELKNKEPEVVVVRPATAPAAPAPVEVKPSPEEKLENKTSVMTWLKQGIERVVPQPEHLKAKAENGKTESPKVEAPPPPPPPAPKPAEETSSTEPQTNVVGWIVSGFQQMLPQPVHKQDGADSVQNRGTCG